VRGPAKRLDGFIAEYAPHIAGLARAAFAKLRDLVPGATVLVYDNYNALAIGFGPNDRASDAVLSLALYPRWVSLFFLQGAALPDPGGLLTGSGKKVRHRVLPDAADLDRPAVRSLIATALARARVPIDPAAESRVIIKSVAATQRPRRPAPEKGRAGPPAAVGRGRRAGPGR
jgi:hypothetical protein